MRIQCGNDLGVGAGGEDRARQEAVRPLIEPDLFEQFGGALRIAICGLQGQFAREIEPGGVEIDQRAVLVEQHGADVGDPGRVSQRSGRHRRRITFHYRHDFPKTHPRCAPVEDLPSTGIA